MLNLILRQYPRFTPYAQLMRLDRPIGTLLLLWPTLWALWLAADGWPSPKLLFIFCAGVFVMRAAGCVINDFADRHLDGHVQRTANRPLATGRATPLQALVLFVGLCFIALLLVLETNLLCLQLAFGGLALAIVYPFMKRHTHLPQVVLGAAFSWAIPMAWAAQSGELNQACWLLFLANLLWTVAYDTQYAMVDREDDLKVGIKSTAILFGSADNLMIALLQGLFLISLLLLAQLQQLGGYFHLGLVGALLLFIWQARLTRHRQPEHCFKAFLCNNAVGALIFAGLVVELWLRTAAH